MCFMEEHARNMTVAPLAAILIVYDYSLQLYFLYFIF